MRLLHNCMTAIVVAIALSGCMEYPIPLGDPESIPNRAALTGRWLQINTREGDEPATMTVTSLGERELLIETFVNDLENGKQRLRMRAHTATLDGVTFVNVTDFDAQEPKQGYSFARYDLSNAGELTIRMVDDRWAKRNVGDIRSFVTKNAANDSLYTDDLLVMRRTTE